MDSTTLTGNVTRDPELRYTSSGKPVANFGLAVNRRYQVNGDWHDKVSFFNVIAWDTLGENLAATLHKGTRVIVSGRLEQRQYETNDGDKRSAVELVADEVGPSLRWAQADVRKITKDHDDPAQTGSDGPVDEEEAF